MKRAVIFLILTIVLSSCVHSDYSIRFIDTKNPKDTLTTTIAHIRENFVYAYFDIIASNKGTYEHPIFVYSLYANGDFWNAKIYSSTYPIIIVDYKYLGKSKNE